MKPNIHPKYYPEAKITCACGASYTIGATVQEMKVEICKQCHPFYTGHSRLIDTAGRVEKFEAKRKRATQKKGK